MAWEKVPVYTSHRSEDRTLKISKLYSTMQGKHTRRQEKKKENKNKTNKKSLKNSGQHHLGLPCFPCIIYDAVQYWELKHSPTVQSDSN